MNEISRYKGKASHGYEGDDFLLSNSANCENIGELVEESKNVIEKYLY